MEPIRGGKLDILKKAKEIFEEGKNVSEVFP